jgi:hypothetical protein
MSSNHYRAIELAIIPRAGRTLSIDAVNSLLATDPVTHSLRTFSGGSARVDMVMADYIGDMIAETLAGR